jgi:hypothetical protein
MGLPICSVYKEEKTSVLTSIDAGIIETLDCRGFRTGLIAIKNTGVTNTLSYKVDGYAVYDGVTAGIADKTATDIAPGATVTFSFDGITRSRRVITVTPKVTGSQSTYVIEYCLGL